MRSRASSRFARLNSLWDPGGRYPSAASSALRDVPPSASSEPSWKSFWLCGSSSSPAAHASPLSTHGRVETAALDLIAKRRLRWFTNHQSHHGRGGHARNMMTLEMIHMRHAHMRFPHEISTDMFSPRFEAQISRLKSCYIATEL